MSGPYTITKYQPRPWWRRNLRQDLRGLLAIALLVITAVDVLVTTAIHLPPLAWCWRQIRDVLAGPWRAAHPEPHVTVVVIDGELDERSA